MYEILLMRHAKSDWHSHTADIDRPLNKRGSRDAQRMGQYLQQSNISPDRAVTSVARRAQDTANLVLECLPVVRDEMTVDKELYLAGLHTLLEAIQLYAIEDGRLMLVAHNPGMDEIVQYLSDTDPVYTDNGKLMTTCAIARFRLDSLDELNCPGRAKLVEIIRPKEIAG